MHYRGLGLGLGLGLGVYEPTLTLSATFIPELTQGLGHGLGRGLGSNVFERTLTLSATSIPELTQGLVFGHGLGRGLGCIVFGVIGVIGPSRGLGRGLGRGVGTRFARSLPLIPRIPFGLDRANYIWKECLLRQVTN